MKVVTNQSLDWLNCHNEGHWQYVQPKPCTLHCGEWSPYGRRAFSKLTGRIIRARYAGFTSTRNSFGRVLSNKKCATRATFQIESQFTLLRSIDKPLAARALQSQKYLRGNFFVLVCYSRTCYMHIPRVHIPRNRWIKFNYFYFDLIWSAFWVAQLKTATTTTKKHFECYSLTSAKPWIVTSEKW